MSLVYNKTTITDVVYNNKPVYKVIYKKGTTSTVVFQKTLSITEKELSYSYTTASSQATFTYPEKESITLKHAPTKVTSLVFTFGTAWKSWNVTINEDGLSGTFVLPKDSATATGTSTNFYVLNWKISSNNIVITGGTESTIGTASWNINITYEYAAE